MPVPALINQDRKVLKDCTVMSLQNQPLVGVAPVALAVLGQIETLEFSIKREFADVTASADTGMSRRAVRFGLGNAKLSGFSAGTSSMFAVLFAEGGHATLLFTESVTGDSWSFLCTCEEYSKSLGKEANKDSLTLQIEGVPYYGPSAGALAPLVLE